MKREYNGIKERDELQIDSKACTTKVLPILLHFIQTEKCHVSKRFLKQTDKYLISMYD